MSLLLRGDCVVEYTSKGVTYANGSWVQRGDLIEFSFDPEQARITIEKTYLSGRQVYPY